MSLEIAAINNAFVAAHKVLKNEASTKIEKYEKAVKELDDAKEQYYNAFWTAQSERSSLDKKNEGSPFYQAQKSLADSQEGKERLKQLDNEIADIDKKLRQFKPEEHILKHKSTIASLRESLQATKSPVFFQQYIVNRAMKNQKGARKEIAPATAPRPS